MGFVDKLLGESTSSRGTEDYVELSADDFDEPVSDGRTQVRIARINDQQDVIDIKDAVYDGDIVIADITRHTTKDRTMENIIDELDQVRQEVGGDIVQKDDDQLIITPGGVSISRERLGR
jgi:hypothetical protein